MRIAVIGAGYVGIVVAACLADVGHAVTLCESDPTRLEMIRGGRSPVREPRLDGLLRRGQQSGRIQTTVCAAEAVAEATAVFIAVGTPPSLSGAPDLTDVESVVDTVAPHLMADALLIVKSTVPVGTAASLRVRLEAAERGDVRVVSNPEFLAEGTAVDDFLQPARIVVGASETDVFGRIRRMYKPMLAQCELLTMSNESAELAKYACNAMLATRVTLMNELATLSTALGSDIEDLRRVVAADPRIGPRYLSPGAGFGGSCFPKDLLALERRGAELGVPMDVVAAVREVNTRQKRRMEQMLLDELPALRGRRIAVWGLSFKPDTDDIRQAPALVLVRALVARGAQVVAYDPAAMGAAGAVLPEAVEMASSALGAVEGADALAIVTEWAEFRGVDLSVVARRMRGRIVVDGRNLYDPSEVAAAGFTYASIGRPVARPVP